MSRTEAAERLVVSGEHAIVVFDGVCNVCDRSVRFLLDHDPEGYFRFAPLQSEVGRSLCRRFGIPTEALDTIVLVEGNHAYQRSAAVVRILGRLAFPWSLGRVFRIVPRPLRDAAYDWFARHRYGWFGKRDECRLPTPTERPRFLGSGLEF